jgi:hypothetical protein
VSGEIVAGIARAAIVGDPIQAIDEYRRYRNSAPGDPVWLLRCSALAGHRGSGFAAAAGYDREHLTLVLPSGCRNRRPDERGQASHACLA